VSHFSHTLSFVVITLQCPTTGSHPGPRSNAASMAQFWQLCMCRLAVKVAGPKVTPWNVQTHSSFALRTSWSIVLCALPGPGSRAPCKQLQRRAYISVLLCHGVTPKPSLAKQLRLPAPACVHFDPLSQTHNVFFALTPVPLLLPSECAPMPMDCCRCSERHQLGCLEDSFPIAFFTAAAVTGRGCTQLVWRQRGPCFAFKCGQSPHASIDVDPPTFPLRCALW
jgi:hypothetical protein